MKTEHRDPPAGQNASSPSTGDERPTGPVLRAGEGPGVARANGQHPSCDPTIRLVVLDEERRHQELFGQVFDRLGVRPEFGGDQTPEQILASKPDAILLSREWSRPWRLIAAAARRANVPVIYVMDGVIEWSYVWNNLSFVRPEGTVLQPLLASHLCVVGRHSARILAGLGLADRIHVVGLPRLDSFSRTRTLTSGQKARILVATAKTFAHNVEQKTLVRRALRDLKNWFDENSFVVPVWRIAEEVAGEIGVEPDRAGTFKEALADVSGAISFSSTCLLEAMLVGVPTAQLDYRAVPLYVQTAWEIRCVEHISGVIQELLYPPPEKLTFQDQCLEDELEQGNASGRLAEVICQAITEARNPSARRPSPAADFGRLDFRQVHSQLSAFSASLHTPLQYELDALQHLYESVRQELRVARQELQTARPAQFEKERLEKVCREQAQVISGLSAVGQQPALTNGEQGGVGLDTILRFADAHYAREDWLAAQDFLTLAVKLAPGQSKIHNALGSLQYQLGDYPAACASFTTAVSQAPDDPDLHVQLAMVLLQLKQRDEAKTALQRALTLRPGSLAARQMLGQLDFDARRYSDAAQHYCALLESNPDEVGVLLQLGFCLHEMRDLVSARWCFGRVIALDPANARAAEALEILAAKNGTAPVLNGFSVPV